MLHTLFGCYFSNFLVISLVLIYINLETGIKMNYCFLNIQLDLKRLVIDRKFLHNHCGDFGSFWNVLLDGFAAFILLMSLEIKGHWVWTTTRDLKTSSLALGSIDWEGKQSLEAAKFKVSYAHYYDVSISQLPGWQKAIQNTFSNSCRMSGFILFRAWLWPSTPAFTSPLP